MNIFKLAVQWYDTKYVTYTSEGIPFFLRLASSNRLKFLVFLKDKNIKM